MLEENVYSSLVNAIDIFKEQYQSFEWSMLNLRDYTRFQIDSDVEISDFQLDEIIDNVYIEKYFVNVDIINKRTVDISLEDIDELFSDISIDGTFKRNATISEQLIYQSKLIKKEILYNIEDFGISMALFEGEDIIVPKKETIQSLIEENNTDEEEIFEIIDNINDVKQELMASEEKINNYINQFKSMEQKLTRLIASFE